MSELILASNSPRRRELLARITPNFTVVPSLFEERAEGLSARETALRFAVGKAEEVFSRYPDCLVLGADTVVSLDGEVLGKPKDGADAADMLRRLSGRGHEVFTGVCLLAQGVRLTEVVATRVTFLEFGEELIGRYVRSGLPFDKAGAYGIQDGFLPVESIEGSYTNVVGFPVDEVRALIAKASEGSI